MRCHVLRKALRLRAVAVVLAVNTAGLSGCVASQANGIGIKLHQTKDTQRTGVVTGIWKYDADENRKRLRHLSDRISDADLDAVKTRYQVRVGIRRYSFVAGLYVEIALLPEEWRHSDGAIIDDGRTVNVGDVVEVVTRPEPNADIVTRIVRKCNVPPTAGEPKEFAHGCLVVEKYGKHGYGGRKTF